MGMKSAQSRKQEILQDKQPDLSTRKRKGGNSDLEVKRGFKHINHAQHVGGPSLTPDSNKPNIKKKGERQSLGKSEQ